MRKDVPWPDPADIARDNAKTDTKKLSWGDAQRMKTQQQRDEETLRRMSKTLFLISKKIVRQVPDDEAGESDLPKGTMKYDEVPDAPNMLGAGGPGKTVCNEPLTNGGGMLSNTIMGNEIKRELIDAMQRLNSAAAKKDIKPFRDKGAKKKKEKE